MMTILISLKEERRGSCRSKKGEGGGGDPTAFIHNPSTPNNVYLFYDVSSQTNQCVALSLMAALGALASRPT